MPPNEITVSAPASIANLGPGYDLFGMALDRPRDILKTMLIDGGMDEIEVGGVGADSISTSPEKNACIVAAKAVLKAAGSEDRSLRMSLTKGIPPGIGMGSSGASSAAGAFAANILLCKPLSELQVLKCAMQGERATCGSPHADNVAPSLMGGITVIMGYEPLRVARLEPLNGIEIVEVRPEIEVAVEKTRYARQVLSGSVPLTTVLSQMESYTSLLLGVIKKDPVMMGRGVSGDVIVEPARARLIPGFYDVKKAALEAGAYGCTISGAGPSIFALAPHRKGAEIGERMKVIFFENGIISDFAIYFCGQEGAMVV